MLSYGLHTCAALLMHTVFPFCHMYLLVYLSYVLTPHTLTGICYMYKNPIQQIHSHLHKWVPFHVECLFLYGCLLSDFMVFLLLTLSPHTLFLPLLYSPPPSIRFPPTHALLLSFRARYECYLCCFMTSQSFSATTIFHSVMSSLQTASRCETSFSVPSYVTCDCPTPSHQTSR